jgi:hypothetical protein
MNEFLAGCIREHIAKSEKGCGISHRLCWHLFMKRISGIRERTGSAGQIIIRDVLENYFLLFSVLLPHMGKHLSGSGSDAG